MRRFLERVTHRRVEGRKNQPDAQRIRNAADTGLKIIYESTSIVAIHGDGGHYKESWTHPDSQVFWLRDLLPSIIPESTIFSFGYSASKLDFVPAEEICRGFLRELSKMREDPSTLKQRPIIFLAHSFGVLLLKAALAMSSSSEFSGIKSSTRGIIFFGSPPGIGHCLQSLVSSFSSSTFPAPEPARLTAMKEDLTWLQDAESRYNQTEKEGQFEVTYFLESAGGNYDPTDVKQERYIRMRKSHGMMIRFPDANDQDFCLVKERIERMMKNRRVN